MANCHDLFQDYNKDLQITKSKRKSLIKSRKALREMIEDYFKEHHPEYVPYFWIQGSYKIKNMIRTKEDTCDCDDGVYFFREPDVSSTTLQKWVKDAVADATSTPPQHRERCIRVIYKDDYHIDLPVYYMLDKDDEEEPAKLAIKNEDFEPNDPKEFVDWFDEKKDEEGQLLRMTRYLKGWGDHKRNKMPSGLAMTVLAEKYFEPESGRDDLCLLKILEEMQADLEENWECRMPSTPEDDLFEDYDKNRKDNFLKNLADFIADAQEAVKEETDKNKASKLWKKHLGQRFPLTEEEQKKEARAESLLAKAVLIEKGGHYTDKNGHITDVNKDTVKNQPHKFYGS